jgi:hypothetical protein
MKSGTERGPLPLMKSFEEATAICEKEQDPFYVDAFMIEAWLGHSALEAAAEYANHKKAKDRALQTGQAWRGFLDLFGQAEDHEFHGVMQSLYRFCEYEDVQAEILRRAIVPLSFEHECLGDFVGPKTLQVAKQPKEAVVLMKRSLERWCEWLEAVLHFRTHYHYHVLPEGFDPDPDKRELGALGVLQRNFFNLTDFGKRWWEWRHREAAMRFKGSFKWRSIGKMAVAPLRDAPADADQIVIMLWPLLKRYHWTYRDLMAVARQLLPPPPRYPLEREQDLAAYCSNVLGLRKHDAPAGKSSPDGRPKGYEVALRLGQAEPWRPSS